MVVMLKRPTIHQIAQELGVSRSTIYKVINDSTGIRSEMRSRVVRALERYGYRPECPAVSECEPDRVRIAFVAFATPPLERFPTTYLDHIRMGLQRAQDRCKERGINVEVDFQAPAIEPRSEQAAALDRLRRADAADGYIVMPAGDRILESIIDHLVADNVPVITVNRDIPTSHRICYVGCDYVTSGRLAAELLGKTAAPGRLLTLIGHEPESMAIDINDRMVGFRSRIADYRHHVVSPPHKFSGRAELCGYLKREIATQTVSGIYDVTGNLHAVGDFLLEHSLQDEISVVGFDLYPETVDYLRRGALTAVIFQDMARQSSIATEMLVEYIRLARRPRESIVHTPLEVVMAENVTYYLDSI